MSHARQLIAPALLLLLCAGCSEPAKPTGVTAPSKPLSAPEEQLLKAISDLPADKRAGYVRQHMDEVMKFSGSNSAFGTRMNELLGVKSSQTKEQSVK